MTGLSTASVIVTTPVLSILTTPVVLILTTPLVVNMTTASHSKRALFMLDKVCKGVVSMLTLVCFVNMTLNAFKDKLFMLLLV